LRSGNSSGRFWRQVYKLVLLADADERSKVLPLLVGEAVDATKIVLGANTTSLGTIAIDASHLKGSKTKAEQLGAVCLVRVEGKGFGLGGIDGIIPR
jgi:hypothetical protein